MMIFVFFVVLSFLSPRTEAIQEEEFPSFIPEIQLREKSCRCSEVAALLSKINGDLEVIKGQILSKGDINIFLQIPSFLL